MHPVVRPVNDWVREVKDCSSQLPPPPMVIFGSTTPSALAATAANPIRSRTRSTRTSFIDTPPTIQNHKPCKSGSIQNELSKNLKHFLCAGYTLLKRKAIFWCARFYPIWESREHLSTLS